MNRRVGFLARYSDREHESILRRNRSVAFRETRDWSEEDAALAQGILELLQCPPEGLSYVEARELASFLCTY